MDPRYPIGKFEYSVPLTPEKRTECIRNIAELSPLLRETVSSLHDQQLNRSYRPGGWTIRQLVHHLADANIIAFTRTKAAFAEPSPRVMAFDENLWADTKDTQGQIEPSLAILTGVNIRWVELLESMEPDDFNRLWIHPSFPTEKRTIDWILDYFSWHGMHHLAHIRLAASK